VSNLHGGNIIDITDVTFSPPELSPPDQWAVLSRTHNHTQLYAIKYVVDRPIQNQDTRICLVQGPPGTGKTKTVLGMISALLCAKNLNESNKVKSIATTTNTSSSSSSHCSTEEQGSGNGGEGSTAVAAKKNRLLICAPSNAAVDELLSRLQDDGIVNSRGKISKPKMVRLGKPLDGLSSSSPSSSSSSSFSRIEQLTLDNQIDAILTQDQLWNEFNSYVEEYHSLLSQLKEIERDTTSSHMNAILVRHQGQHSNNGSSNRDDLVKKIKNKIHKIRSKKIATEIYLNQKRITLRKEILESADIVASTLSTSGQSLLVDHIIEHNLTFETVIVDEAGQSTEPATLIPLRYGCRRLVLVGDARQLPAYVCSKEAEKAGLGVSLFERLERSGHEIVLLTVRYPPPPS
jgi:senataxin